MSQLIIRNRYHVLKTIRFFAIYWQIICPLPNDHVRLHVCGVGGSHYDSGEESNPLVRDIVVVGKHDVVIVGKQHSSDCPED